MIKRLVLQSVLLLLATGLAVGVRAQVSTVGSISGTVRDSKGAGIPKAEVTIQERDTKKNHKATADANGFYSIQGLPVGHYTVSSAPKGFKTTVNNDVEVHVGDNLEINLVVEVGQISETVTVTSETAQVETRSGEVASLVSEKQVTELPLNGRNYAQLVTLVPGFSPVTQAGAGGAFKAQGTGLDSGVDFSSSGNGSNENLFTVDGVNNMDVGSNRTLLVFPSIDSIAEFKVERNSYSAEYGQAQGAVVNLVTKGGGNQFHGTGFEFLRNDALNSNEFFLNRAAQPRGVLRYNNFGFNFNGPVVLPGFGNGDKWYHIFKDKAFFYWSEEWRRERRGQVLTGNSPTSAELRGDFSGPLTGPLPIDPTTGNPFVGNKIPTNRLSPVGLALMGLYPGANTPNVTNGQNFATSLLQPVSTRQDLIRGDFNLTSKMSLMVRYINESWTHGQDTQQWGDSPFPTLSSDWNQPSNSFAVKLTNTLNSTTVNEFQFSRAGNDIIITTSPQTQAAATAISSIFPTVFPSSKPFVPAVFWGPGGYNTLWHQAPWNNHEDLFIWKDDFSKVIGRNDLKFGVLYSHNIKNEQGNGASGGNTPVAISGCGAHTGNCVADFLLKDTVLVEYQEQTVGGNPAPISMGRWHDFELYGNDTWKVRKNVTLTLGMRYSRFPPAIDADNRMSNYITSLYDGKNVLSGLVTADQSSKAGLPQALVNTYGKGFLPRIGIAWDVFGNGKTALRMGFGRYMARTNVIEDINRMVSNPPFTTAIDQGWQGSTATLANCPTCRSLDTINPGLAGQVAGITNSFAAVDPNFRPPDSYQWNLTVSREIMKDTVLEVSYVGNEGHHIWRRNVPFNDIAPGPARLQEATLIANGQATAPFEALNRKLPGLGGIALSESTGNSHYHGLQIWLNRRFSKRLAYQVSYTWSHAISDVALTSFTNSVTDPYNFSLDKGDADLDRRQSLVSNLVYNLPSFKRWGSFASKALGDWQINGIFSYFGSTPVNITDNVNTAGIIAGVAERPNLNPGVPIYLNTGDSTQWLNPAAFSLPAPGQIGSLGPGSIRGKPITNVDASINKNWRLREKVSLQFRMEGFNIFNHPSFNGFNNVINFQGNRTLAGYGTVTNANSFGTLTSDTGHREFQFGLKLSF